MAYVKKGYIGDSSVSAKMNNGNTKIRNGVVYKAYGGTGTGGKNLTANGYPSSRGTIASTPTYALRSTTASTPKASAPAQTASYESYESYDNDYDDGADAYSALIAAYQQKQREYEEYLRQQREAAQRAYDRGMSSLNSAYDSQMKSLSSNLDETKNQLLDSYNRSKSNVNQDAESSLRQAYINKMLSEKNLRQQLSALGLTGGASETTLANMANNYGNARNSINTTMNNNLSNLEGNYNSSLAQAMQAYNSAVADTNSQKSQQVMALENALANNEIAALGNYQNLLQRDNDNYLDLLKTAVANTMKYSYNPTKASNNVSSVAVNQAANPTLATNYRVLQELMDGYTGNGATNGVTLANPTTNNNYLAAILQQLRG